MKKMRTVKRMVCFVLAAVLMLGGIFVGRMEVYASMEDKAEDIVIGDVMRGTTTTEQHYFYYRFTLESKQRIVIKGTMAAENLDDFYSLYSEIEYSDWIIIYDSKGDRISLCQLRNGEYDKVNDTFSINVPLTLNKGTYYVEVHHHYSQVDFAYTTEYAPSTKYPSVDLAVSMKAGDSLQLGTVISPENAFKKVKWTTSNKNVATVSSNGKVKAKNAGVAIITIKCKGTKVKVYVVVQ